jgi:CRP-like cAMP-binding protein
VTTQQPDDFAGFAVLRRLTPVQRSTLAALTRPVAYADGAQLFEDGASADECWLIRTGLVSLASSVPGRGLVEIQTLSAGDVLGWSWLVPPHHWHFTATAKTAVEALEFDAVRLRALAADDPALGYPLALGLLESLLLRLQSSRSRLLDLYGSPRERIERSASRERSER